LPQRIYLDHAATSPLRPEAKAAMEEGFRIWANPSSPHAEGRKARAALEDARERIKAALGWDGELIFTSGAREALAIGLGRAKVERRIVGAVEHDAVFRAAPDAEVAEIRDRMVALRQDLASTVVAIQQVNPETGAMMLEIGDVFEAVSNAGGLLLADCSQGAGKSLLPACDMAVVSAHKLGGPVGIGALLVRDFALLDPTGGQERGYRQGTENLPAILGFAAAMEAGGIDAWRTTREQRSQFWDRLAENWLITGQVHCDYIRSLTHSSLSAQATLIRLDAMGFAISAGSACSSGSLKPSRVLKAFGIDDEAASRTVRVSMGWSTTPDELDGFAEAWKSLN
jgi:cysteine desulfurase